MKKSNLTKVLLMVLSLALLVGSIVAVGASASESNAVEIKAKNLAYTDNLTMLFAVDASIEDALAGDVKVAYYWEADGVATLKAAKFLNPYNEDGQLVKEYVCTENGVNYPVFYTEGVPAKDLGKVVYVTAYTGELADDAAFATYSVAEYLYARLYKDGFVNATEGKDLLRKNTYENLLAYGASAQELLVNYGKADADKVALVTDYTYIITSTAGATVNGDNTVISAGPVTVEMAYVGEGTLVGWTVTDASGEVTEYSTSTFTVSGVAYIEPIFGVHECSDVDPADHYCDVCGEVASECADGDDRNHACDVCGKVIEGCNDADGNGACDECGLYAFENDITSGVNLYTFSSTGNANPANQTSITSSSTSTGYYGVLASLASDPAGAANKVMKIVINGGTNNSNTSGLTSYLPTIDLVAAEKVEGGKIHVIEYDIYVERLNKSGVRNFMTLYAFDSDGKGAMLQNGGKDGGTNGHIKAIQAVTGSDKVANCFQVGVGTTQSENSNYALFDSHTWYRFRYVYDVEAGTITSYVSFDKGENWYLATAAQESTSLSYAGVDPTKIERMCISFTHYGHGEVFYIDNASYVVTDTAPTAHAESGIDSVEALYR